MNGLRSRGTGEHAEAPKEVYKTRIFTGMAKS